MEKDTHNIRTHNAWTTKRNEEKKNWIWPQIWIEFNKSKGCTILYNFIYAHLVVYFSESQIIFNSNGILTKKEQQEHNERGKKRPNRQFTHINFSSFFPFTHTAERNWNERTECNEFIYNVVEQRRNRARTMPFDGWARARAKVHKHKRTHFISFDVAHCECMSENAHLVNSYSQSLLLLLPFLILFLRIHIQRMKTNRDSLTATINEKRESEKLRPMAAPSYWFASYIGIVCKNFNQIYKHECKKCFALFFAARAIKTNLEMSKIGYSKCQQTKVAFSYPIRKLVFFPLQGKR